MQKRGQIVFGYLFSLILGAIVIVAFVQAGKSYGRQDAYYKLAVAEDLALTIDLVYSMPGDLEYVYPNNLDEFGVEIKENSVMVYDTGVGKLDPTAASYPFAGTHQEPDFTISGKKFIKIIKERNSLKFEGVE